MKQWDQTTVILSWGRKFLPPKTNIEIPDPGSTMWDHEVRAFWARSASGMDSEGVQDQCRNNHSHYRLHALMIRALPKEEDGQRRALLEADVIQDCYVPPVVQEAISERLCSLGRDQSRGVAAHLGTSPEVDFGTFCGVRFTLKEGGGFLQEVPAVVSWFLQAFGVKLHGNTQHGFPPLIITRQTLVRSDGEWIPFSGNVEDQVRAKLVDAGVLTT